jgi:NIMA (never in mitosis gene a)-related kinase
MAALRPPFIANDLQGLYKKICGGYYQRIPIEYSNELMSVINSLLKINPNERPTADSLLMSSIVQKRNKIAICYLPVLDNNILLDTIKLNNRNLKHINQLLPAPKY